MFEGISHAGRRPNHGCRISADGTGPSAREALCTSPTVRSVRTRRRAGLRPAQCGQDRSSSSPSLPDLIRGGTSFRGDQHKASYARPAHLCSRHQRPAGRPERPEPLRRARGRASDRRGDGTGGQEAPSGTRLLRPAGPAPARRIPGAVRPPRRPHPDRGTRWDRTRRAQPLGPQRPAQRVPPGGQRLPHPRGRPQPAGRGVRRHRRLEGPAAQDQGLVRRSSPRSTARNWPSRAPPAGPECPN